MEENKGALDTVTPTPAMDEVDKFFVRNGKIFLRTITDEYANSKPEVRITMPESTSFKQFFCYDVPPFVPPKLTGTPANSVPRCPKCRKQPARGEYMDLPCGDCMRKKQKRVVKRLQKQGLTTAQIAKRLGIARQTVRNRLNY